MIIEWNKCALELKERDSPCYADNTPPCLVAKHKGLDKATLESAHRQGHACFLYSTSSHTHTPSFESTPKKRKIESKSSFVSEPTEPVMLIMWGANQGLQEDMLEFHFKTKTWSRRQWTVSASEHGQLHCGPKAFFGNTLPCNSKVAYILGGYEKKKDGLCVTNELWQYDIVKSTFHAIRHPTWNQIPSILFTPRMAHTLCHIPPPTEKTREQGGMLVVFGGETVIKNDNNGIECKRYNDVAAFHLDTQEWKNVLVQGSPPSARQGHSVVHYTTKASSRGILIFYGGSEWINTKECFKKSSQVVYLDLDTQQWIYPTIKSPIPPGRSHHSAVLYQDKMIVYGGFVDKVVSQEETLAGSGNVHISSDALLKASQQDVSNTLVSNDVWIFDLDACQWEQGHFQYGPAPRASHSAIMLGNQMMVFGGELFSPLQSLQIWSMDLTPALPVFDIQVEQYDGRGFKCKWMDPFSFLFNRQYRIYVCKDTSPQPRHLVYQGTDQHCIITRLSDTDMIQPKTKYVIQVVAFNALGESSVWDGKTLPAMPALEYPRETCDSCVILTTDKKRLPCPTQLVAQVQDGKVVLEWNALDAASWTDSQSIQEYEIQVNCVFEPDVFQRFMLHSDSEPDDQVITKKRKISSMSSAKRDHSADHLVFEKQYWTLLSLVQDPGKSNQKMSKEYTFEDLKSKAALNIFDTRLVQHTVSQSNRRTLHSSQEPLTWPPECHLYYRFRIKSRDASMESNFAEFDIQVHDASLMNVTVDDESNEMKSDSVDASPTAKRVAKSVQDTQVEGEEIEENKEKDPFDPMNVFANEWYLNLGFGDSIQVFCDDEWWECRVVNYIRITTTQQIGLFFYYRGFGKADGAGRTLLTLGRDEIAQMVKEQDGNMKKVLKAQADFIKKSACIRPHLYKNRCAKGSVENASLFTPGERSCVFPKGYGEAKKGKKVIIEQKALSYSRKK